MTEPNYRQILINLCASMGNEDNSSDFAGAAWHALKQIDINPPEDVGDVSELRQYLGREHGAVSRWGESTYEEDES